MIIQVPFYKKLFSYFYPVPIRRGTGDFNVYLEVLLYCNRFQLATADALYSDGDRYVPAVAAIGKLDGSLQTMHRVLVLGAGLGSMVRVLSGKGISPSITLVERDKVVLEWAMEFLGDRQCDLTPVCADAQVFMARNTEKYDFVFIDIFNGRVVPDFVFSAPFLRQCRLSLTAGGHVAFNYLVNNKQQWEYVKYMFTDTFPKNEVVSVGVNRILIAGAQ